MNSHRTAVARTKLSPPMRYLLDNGCLLEGVSILDFGCGRGTDVDILNARGLTAHKYDPHYFPKRPRKTRFEVVTCHYVLNTVRHAAQVMWAAWERVAHKGILVVTVRAKSEVDYEARKASWRKSGGGYVTGSGTFQRGFTMARLVSLARTLDGVCTIEEIKMENSHAVMVIAHKW